MTKQECRIPQDLHIHTVFSEQDSSVVQEQTPELIAHVGHARTMGISDHFEHFADHAYDRYVDRLRGLDLRVGTEVDGAASVGFAAELDFDYYIYHCRDRTEDYRAIERLLATERPVIIAHPHVFQTDLERIPTDCLVELNNRYIWRCDWASFYGPFRERFRFVMSSDAHQPNWLNQNVARHVQEALAVRETLLFA
ncbi:MAG: hypothetical protein PVJ03_08310 [Chromatiaceae bacterium]|jgi:hypothetical protein